MNKLILGTVQFGIPYGINNASGQISLSESMRILNAAFDAGIDTLDTAEAYGTAHSVIGEFHKTFPQRKFKIITKLPHEIDDELENKVYSYITELQVQKLSTLLFHSYQTFKQNTQNLDQLINLKNNGLIENIGVSVYTNEEIEDVLNYDEIDVIQLPFNIFDNLNLRGRILEKAKQKNKIIHTRSCFLQGLFFQPLNSEKKIVSALQEELTFLNQLALTHNLSIQQIALNYSIQQPFIDQVLIGVDNIEQLRSNLNDSIKSISEEVIKEIEKIKIAKIDLLNPSLWNNL